MYKSSKERLVVGLIGILGLGVTTVGAFTNNVWLTFVGLGIVALDAAYMFYGIWKER